MIEVEVTQHVYSNAPGGRTGNWSYTKIFTLACRPVAGDELAHGRDGNECDTVKRVYLGQGTKIYADLAPVQTDSPQIVDELKALRKAQGWTQSGAPWAETRRNDGPSGNRGSRG